MGMMLIWVGEVVGDMVLSHDARRICYGLSILEA